MTTSTLWAGTNAGAIYVFTVSLPKENRETEAVACQLGKVFLHIPLIYINPDMLNYISEYVPGSIGI